MLTPLSSLTGSRLVKRFFLRYNKSVRLDLFLKTARLIKRRARARELCDQGGVMVNGREAKPAKDVHPGDIILLQFPSRRVEIEVIGALDGPSNRNASPELLYRIRAETRLRKEDDPWNQSRS